MSDFGITEKGFKVKRLEDILASKRARTVELFTDLVPPNGIVDTSSSSLLGRLISLSAPGEATLWELSQMVYMAFDPNSATGIALDNLVSLAGLERQRESSSTVALLLTGSTGTFISNGLTVSSRGTGEQFTTTVGVGLTPEGSSGISVEVSNVEDGATYTITYSSNVNVQTINYVSVTGATAASILNGLLGVIDATHPSLTASISGTSLNIQRADVFQRATFTASTNLLITKVSKLGEAVSVTKGPIEQPAGTITSIVTPALGWDSVINPVDAIAGRLEETDEELRIRFAGSKFERATNIMDSLYSSLISVDGAGQVVIYENDTSIVDQNGLPPHSFLPIVIGGSATDIAAAIWRNRPIGILSYGNTSVDITDAQGFSREVRFSRPDPVIVFIEIDLTTNSEFPPNGPDLIRTAIIDFFDSSLGIGDDVVYSRLFTPINSVNGHQVDAMTIGTDLSSMGMSNVIVGFDEVASVSAVNIIVNTN